MRRALTTFFHASHALLQWPTARAFARGRNRLEAEQDQRLVSALAGLRGSEAAALWKLDEVRDLASFRKTVPIREYTDFEALIEKQRKRPEAPVLRASANLIRRFEPTSGSTQARKWIPYTTSFLEEFDAAAGPWLFDMSRRHPSILSGRHYWSLSWLPSDLRSELESTDDLELFPPWKRFALKHTMAVRSPVAHAPTLEESFLMTLVDLVDAEDLSFISVWSPTFLLSLLRSLDTKRDTIARRLTERGRSDRAHLLRSLDPSLGPEDVRKLWPRLSLVSCWTSASSAPFADELRQRLPKVALEGKGLWATEGVVTIPLGGERVLAYRSHFYEFRDLEDGRLFRAHELRAGQYVEPILSGGNGLLRYRLPDRLHCTRVSEGLPCLEFQGRSLTVDLTGEKLDVVTSERILGELSEQVRHRCLTLYARAPGAGLPPYYLVLAEGPKSEAKLVAAQAEKRLMGLHHYRLSRELGQLEAAQALMVPDAVAFLGELARQAGGIAGGQKIEALRTWPAGVDPASLVP